MEQYLSKSDVVAEINRVLNSYDPNEITSGRYALISLRDFLDILEVKELQKKTEENIDNVGKFNEKIYEDGITWLFGHHCLECEHLTFSQHEIKELAKYFFELGLKIQKGE
jgi:hypothetical protein